MELREIQQRVNEWTNVYEVDLPNMTVLLYWTLH